MEEKEEKWERPLEIVSIQPAENTGEIWLRVYMPSNIKSFELTTDGFKKELVNQALQEYKEELVKEIERKECCCDYSDGQKDSCTKEDIIKLIKK